MKIAFDDTLCLFVLSAGVGRTGCFIASSIGCQQLRETAQVDILETVCQLRLDRWAEKNVMIIFWQSFHCQRLNPPSLPPSLCRGGMIQTPEQYQFLYTTLAKYSSQLQHNRVLGLITCYMKSRKH